MAMDPFINMQSVKAAAKAQFGNLDGVIGFGIGDHVLRIYVRDSKVRERLPAEFQGASIEVVVTGDVSAQT
jgi:hypothetical protein